MAGRFRATVRHFGLKLAVCISLFHASDRDSPSPVGGRFTLALGFNESPVPIMIGGLVMVGGCRRQRQNAHSGGGRSMRPVDGGGTGGAGALTTAGTATHTDGDRPMGQQPMGPRENTSSAMLSRPPGMRSRHALVPESAVELGKHSRRIRLERLNHRMAIRLALSRRHHPPL